MVLCPTWLWKVPWKRHNFYKHLTFEHDSVPHQHLLNCYIWNYVFWDYNFWVMTVWFRWDFTPCCLSLEKIISHSRHVPWSICAASTAAYVCSCCTAISRTGIEHHLFFFFFFLDVLGPDHLKSKYAIFRSSLRGAVVNKSDWEPWGCSSIPGLAQWVKDPALPWAVV